MGPREAAAQWTKVHWASVVCSVYFRETMAGAASFADHLSIVQVYMRADLQGGFQYHICMIGFCVIGGAASKNYAGQPGQSVAMRAG